VIRRAIFGPAILALSMCAVRSVVFAQTLVGTPGSAVHIVGSDLAVLESQEVRKEINCTVTPQKPILGFDLRFHAGFTAAIPLKDLAGSENTLHILFRVTPADQSREPTYFVQHYSVPKIDEGAGGDAYLEGVIDLGEGKFHVDWMMRDRSESVCTFFWDMNAELPSKDREIPMETPAGVVEAAHFELFTPEPPVARVMQAPLKVKVLVNFAPQNPYAATMRPIDSIALISILRRIVRQPEFGKFSLVAFNIQEQRVLYRQDSEEQIDFPALGDALKSIKPGVVDMRRLQNKHGDTEFLTDLIQKEMSGDDHPDALIFAGPKVMLDQSVPEETLKPLSVDYPVFYLNYAVNPQAIPWRDSIGRAIRLFRGTEYTISRPRDLWYSFSDMVSRIVKLRQGRYSPESTQ
jgi:hypothetical protein